MLQIFNADSTTDEVVPLIVSLARQLHAETEKRFFLEEAIDLLDLETGEDSSTLMNVLNLLNRTAGTKQILIADRDGQLFESSFCVVSRLTLDQEMLTMPLLDQREEKRWMIAIGDSNKRSLKDQRSLFESARRLLERLIVDFD